MDPLLFEPYFRPQVWGGRQLATRLAKPLPAEGLFGESWELSAHPLHVSRVAEGPFRGWELDELWSAHRMELAGPVLGQSSRFPWLIKYLDCRDNLSVQVHPNDGHARALLAEASGKSEAWVILEAEPAARIYAGWKCGVSRSEVERRLAEGTLVEALNVFTPRPGDCCYIPAGTVHALGGGLLVAEIQQSSDATFRLFDWNRRGTDGLPRPLHVAESLSVMDWNRGPIRPLNLDEQPTTSHSGVTREHLISCEHFRLERQALMPGAAIRAAVGVVMVLAGEAVDVQTGRCHVTGTTLWIPDGAEDRLSAGPLGCVCLLVGAPIVTDGQTRATLSAASA